MNAFEHFFCSSSLWAYLTERQLLPWVLSGARLGDHLLELGAGYGAATPYLRKRVTHVTSLEYDSRSLAKLKARRAAGSGGAVRGDAARLPFADGTFSSALAILMLHHLPSKESQDRMFAEVLRVLIPGGVFVAFELQDGWIHRVGHIKSMFTPLSPGSAHGRLTDAGFANTSVEFRRSAFRVSAIRPLAKPAPGA